MTDAEYRIRAALEVAERHGGTDGAHHLHYVVDQMVRALTGCPMVADSAIDCRGNSYTFQSQGESEEYKTWVAEVCAGEDGPHTYDWDVGIPP